MPKTVEAIFEEGVLKPISPLNIPEHKKVTLIIEDEHVESTDILSLSSMIYNGLSPEDIKEIEELAFDRSHFSRH
ncbi:MAG: antitoxin family protein [Nitrospirae bacterium]|nr:antitoxin family protein [Nitrospirota bacterium]